MLRLLTSTVLKEGDIVEIAEQIRMLDEMYGKDNWCIRKISRDARGRPSLTLSSIFLKKLDVKVGDKVLVVVRDGQIIIQRI